MAKKKVESVAGSRLSFSDLAKKLQDINPEGVIASEDSEIMKIENWIGTGNYLLNAQISGSLFKGIPEGRVTMVAGESGCLHPKQKVKVYISKNTRVKNIENLP